MFDVATVKGLMTGGDRLGIVFESLCSGECSASEHLG